MSQPSDIDREAFEWVLKLASGEFSARDRQLLLSWQERSREHRAAFAQAALVWTSLTPDMALKQPPRVAYKLTSRRAVLAGSMAASAAILYAAMQPPLDLWPSVSELRADYRTGTGERRRITLSQGALLDLNTKTSVNYAQADNAALVTLIAGEMIVTAADAATAVTVVAGPGRTSTSEGRFAIRDGGEDFRITCLDGAAELRCLGQILRLSRGETVTYSHAAIKAPHKTDTEAALGWLKGVLVFRNDPLRNVIAEINRYRPGRIVLLNEDAGRRPIFATLPIAALDDAIRGLENALNLRVQRLPGGVVIIL